MRGSWRLNRTATYWPPLYWPWPRFFPILQGCSTGGLGAPPLWELVFSTASYLRLIWSPKSLASCLHRGYIIIWRPLFFLRASQFRTFSTLPRSRLWYPDIPRPDAPVIYTGAFPILTAWPGRRSIYNIHTQLNVNYSISNNLIYHKYVVEIKYGG